MQNCLQSYIDEQKHVYIFHTIYCWQDKNRLQNSFHLILVNSTNEIHVFEMNLRSKEIHISSNTLSWYCKILNIKKIHIRKLIMKCIIDYGVYIHGNDFMSIWFHIGVGISRAQVLENRIQYRITISISLKMNLHSSVNLLYQVK